MSWEISTVIVVGCGPIGAATARHLAELGKQVTVVGPDEPSDFRNHQGLWSGHYDSGRLACIDMPLIPTLLGLRAMRRFPQLEADTGVTFSSRMPVMNVLPANAAELSVAMGGSEAMADEWLNVDALLANIAEFGGNAEVLDDDQLRARFPHIKLPPGHLGVLQHDAMILNPRNLVRAELTAAARRGVQRVTEEVVTVESGSTGARVVTRQGRELTADAVVLATGAMTNACELLPRPIAAEVVGCTIVLLEVAGPDAASIPTLMPSIFSEDMQYAGIVAPPLQYPDGRWYMKGTGADLLSNPLRSYEEIGAWVRTGGSEVERDHFLGVFSALLPDVEYTSVQLKPCLPTFNATQLPYIGFVEDRVALATEGERGVMMADEIGRLTARMLHKGRWDDTMPGHLFEVQYA